MRAGLRAEAEPVGGLRLRLLRPRSELVQMLSLTTGAVVSVSLPWRNPPRLKLRALCALLLVLALLDDDDDDDEERTVVALEFRFLLGKFRFLLGNCRREQ